MERLRIKKLSFHYVNLINQFLPNSIKQINLEIPIFLIKKSNNDPNTI